MEIGRTGDAGQPDDAARSAFVEELWHRRQIEDAMLRYCRGLDRQDYELLRSAYHPDAHDDHGTYKGDVDGLIAWARERHAHIEQSMHLLGNCSIERVGDVALVETYCIAHLRFDPASASAGAMYTEAGMASSQVAAVWYLRYVDRFERRPDWRIAERTVVLEHVRTEPVGDDALADDAWVRSRRDGDDLLWSELAQLRDGS